MSKVTYKVCNWHQYNEGLKRRGQIHIWIQEGVLEEWQYRGKQSRGGKRRYSDLAIETCLIVRQVYHLPLRQTQGFVESFFSHLSLAFTVPDYSTLSRRSATLPLRLQPISGGAKAITDIVVDSTGLKVYGEGEWKVRKHGFSKYRTWQKLHVALSAVDQQIQSVVLSSNSLDDGSALQPLLTPLKGCGVKRLIGDGGYDQHKVRKWLFDQGIEAVIALPKDAVPDQEQRAFLGQRDRDIALIREKGRTHWKEAHHYHLRSLSETAIFRYKTIIGDHLKARTPATQSCEATLGCRILNTMLQLAKPQSVRVAC